MTKLSNHTVQIIIVTDLGLRNWNWSINWLRKLFKFEILWVQMLSPPGVPFKSNRLYIHVVKWNSILETWRLRGSGAAKLVQIYVQGDHSACARPPVDFKTKALLWPGQAKAALLFWSQREVLHKLNGHPVCTFWSHPWSCVTSYHDLCLMGKGGWGWQSTMCSIFIHAFLAQIKSDVLCLSSFSFLTRTFPFPLARIRQKEYIHQLIGRIGLS